MRRPMKAGSQSGFEPTAAQKMREGQRTVGRVLHGAKHREVGHVELGEIATPIGLSMAGD